MVQRLLSHNAVRQDPIVHRDTTETFLSHKLHMRTVLRYDASRRWNNLVLLLYIFLLCCCTCIYFLHSLGHVFLCFYILTCIWWSLVLLFIMFSLYFTFPLMCHPVMCLVAILFGTPKHKTLSSIYRKTHGTNTERSKYFRKKKEKWGLSQSFPVQYVGLWRQIMSVLRVPKFVEESDLSLIYIWWITKNYIFW